MARPPLSTLGAEQLEALLGDLGAPPWRAAQVRRALWQPQVRSSAELRVLPVALRSALEDQVLFSTVEVVAQTEADGGETVKLLCRLPDGQTVETVAMESPAGEVRTRRRATVCVSSQVGCAVGCPFCATGQLGLTRNCTAAEIVDQVRAAGTALYDHGYGAVTHVVYMGMGEPLANYASTVASLRLLAAEAGIRPRRLTVSTSGVVSAIDRLAAESLPVTLAISLHAANDTLRNRLVPINRAHGLERLVEAALGYAAATGRRVTWEWCLIGGVNDSATDARQLRELAYRTRAHVNIIPMNHVDGSPWGPPPAAVAADFVAGLRGVSCTVRDTRGSDVNAACGQLRASLEPRRAVQSDGTLAPPRPLIRA